MFKIDHMLTVNGNHDNQMLIIKYDDIELQPHCFIYLKTSTLKLEYFYYQSAISRLYLSLDGSFCQRSC